MAKKQIYKPEYQLNPFFDLSENEFEDLCRDLFAKSSEVTHARRLFGKGYKQYGGDVLIQTGGSDASFVAQCKHYPVASFSRGDIEQAVDLFVNYWESHWKKFNVSRFYLIVARPLTTDDQALTVQEQRIRLLDLGVDFIYWDSGDLKTELKPHRQLVREYLGNYWEQICPPDSGAMSAGNAAAGFVGDQIAERLLNRDYEQMASRLSEATRDSLEPIRELARTGRQVEAFAQICEIKTKSFDYLDGKTRAEVLSLEIRLGFPRQINSATARRILEQIKREDSDFQALYLDALITSYERGFATALDKIAFCPDVSTFNLKLTFLINSGEFAAAEREYQAESARLAYDVETKRLHAAILLGQGKIAEAENQIDEVFAEKSDWEGVLTIKAIVYYFAGLAAASASKNPLAFPHPQPWHLVKTDDESQRKRREAAEMFEARLASGDREFEDRRILETWHLACLSDDPLRQAEALDYCRALLLSDPAHPYALIWAIDRNFEIDFAAAKNFLAAQFAARGDFPEEKLNEALILLPLYLRSDEFERAAAHLEKIKPVLDKIGNSYLADYWYCQIEIARTEGASLDARRLNLIENAELRRSLQIVALGVRYRKNPSRANRRTLLRRLLKLYRRFGDTLALYNYCLLCHEQKNWREIAFYAQNLLDLIQTSDAVRITANAFYQNKQPQKTLDALNQFRRIFPRGELPADLSRLKSYALLLSGHPAQAAREARGLFEREKSAENLLALIETARHTDDLFSINRAIEQMPKLDDLTPKQQLKISHLLSAFNPELASEMWRMVKSRIGEAEDVVDDLYFQGQKLGLGREAEMLFPKVLENAKRGSSSSRMMMTEEWLEWFKTRTAELEELEELYQTGQFPVHIYCERRNLPLAELFHTEARLNLETESVLQKRKIMTRNAARPERLSEVFPKREADWRFHFDLTTLLLAHELDLLSVIEKCAPVFVSNEVIPFIKAEIEGVQKSSPESVAAVQIVLRALDANLCRRFVVSHSVSEPEREQNAAFLSDFNQDDLRLLLQAAEEKAAVIVSYPLRNGQNGKVIELPENFAEVTFDWRNVVAVLLSTDALTVKQKSIAETELNKEKWQNRSQFLPPGTNLWLTGRAATELTKLGLLEETCRVFPVAVDERNETALREDVRRYERESETVNWLESLKERLRRGFESETYQGISLERLKDAQKSGVKEKEIPDYRERSIREILRLVPSDDSNDAAVIDDRFLSRHAAVENTIPLFTIYELLEYLKTGEFLGEDEYFDCLMRLRERNFRYLSVTSDEIFYHFRRATTAQASLDDSRFTRSRELAVLRRYFSDCLLDEKLLQRPEPSPAGSGGANNLGEMRFVLGSERAVTEAIGRVWREADSLETARTQADLLLFDFYVGSFNLRHFFEDFAVLEAGAYHLASDFVSLSFQGVNLLTAAALTAATRTERAAAFFDWVNQIFSAKFRRNPQIVEHAVKILVNAFTLTLSSLPGEDSESDTEKAQRMALAVVYSQFINFLPEAISNRLFEIDDLWQSLVLPAPEAVVTIGRMKFGAAALWRAVAAALAGELAMVQLYNGSERIFDVTRESDNEKPLAVRLTDENGNFFCLTGSFVGLQLPVKTERATFLLKRRGAFDCAEDEMRKAIEEIADTGEPDARAARYNERASRSMQIAYQNLSEQITERKHFSWGGITEMPMENLSKHFRFTTTAENAQETVGEDDFLQAAEQLWRDEGLEIALDRFARFPRPLPEFLLVELQKLELDARKSLLEKLRTNWHSPVHKFHYLYVALRALPDEEETLIFARKVAGELLRPETSGEQNIEFEVFKVLVKLVADEFSRSPATRLWTIPRRLIFAWAHAAEIYNLVAPIADSREEWTKMLEYFNSMRPFWGGEILSFEPDYWGDWLHPRFLERESFAAFAAGSLFAAFPLEEAEKIELPKLLAELCFVEMEGDRVPHYNLWKDFTLRTNAADSFLDAQNLELFYSLLNTENVKFYQPGVLSKYLDQVLEKLAADAQATEIWLELSLLTDGLPLKEISQTKLAETVGRIDFAALWETDQEEAWFILSTVAAQNINFPTDLQQKSEDWLVWAVERLADKYPSRFNQRMTNREEQTRIALRIVDVAAWLAVVPLDQVASSRNWNRLIERLGRIWSNLHLWLEPFLFRCWTDLPVEQIQGLGRNLLLAKATR